MSSQTPANAPVQIDHETGVERLTISAAKRATGSWLAGAVFVAVIFKFSMLASQFVGPALAGDFPFFPFKAFVIFWVLLAGVIGSLILWIAWLCIRPGVPSTLELDTDEIRFDSGVIPLAAASPELRKFPPGVSRRSLFKRQRRVLPRVALDTLALQDTDGTAHLTVDVAGERIRIGAGLRSTERHWLFAHLKAKYRLSA